MKNFILLTSVFLGITLLNVVNLSAQSKLENTLEHKYFAGGLLNFYQQNLEGSSSTNFFLLTASGMRDNLIVRQIRSSRFNSNPYFGIRLNPSSSVGILQNFSLNRFTYLTSLDETAITSSSILGIGAFYRKEINLNRDFIFYYQPEVQFSSTRLVNIHGEEKILTGTLKTMNAGLNIGVLYSFNKYWSLISNLAAGGYRFQVQRHEIFDLKSFRHEFDLNINLLSFSLGLERAF